MGRLRQNAHSPSSDLQNSRPGPVLLPGRQLSNAQRNPSSAPQRIWAALKNYVANTAVTWPGRLRQIHSFFRARSPDEMLDTAAPWTAHGCRRVTSRTSGMPLRQQGHNDVQRGLQAGRRWPRTACRQWIAGGNQRRRLPWASGSKKVSPGRDGHSGGSRRISIGSLRGAGLSPSHLSTAPASLTFAPQ
jgi:hypothetical protein